MVFPVVGGTQSTGYEISNSLRFNDDDGADLGRAPSADGNRKTFTFSTWLKIGNIPSADYDFFSANSTNNFNDVMRIRSDESLQISATVSGDTDNGYKFRSDMKFRDPSAWYHIVVGVDTTQATNSNGLKVYVNGSLISGTYDAYNQNISTSFNKDGSTMAIGHRQNDGGNHYDGYISETHFIDGTQLDSSYFGETNDNGVWIPKKYTGSYGTNGFFLEYQQTGTSQNSSGIGADTSGNDNHFAVTNLAATDITVDTPTNNFATLNPLINSNGTYTLSEGNTKFVADGSNGWNTTTATMGFSKGKWYWEQKFTQVTGSASFAGLVKDDVNHADDDISGQDDSEGVLYYATGNYMFGASGTYVSGGASFGASFDDGDIISVAADLDNNKMYFAKNGTYQGSGDPANGSNGLPISEGAQGLVAGSFSFVFPYAGAYYANDGCEWNFGNAPFSISSGNADANGYGNFEYAVPSGFYSLCTKNLAEFG